MGRIKFVDVMFWIVVLMTLFVILWKLHGSPSDFATIVSLGIFLLTSEILTWKKIYSIEKETSLGFMRVKHDLDKFRIEVNNKLDRILEDKK